MEAFTLLKYWRPSPPTNTAIPSAASSSLTPPTSDDDDEEEEDGPYFDLEFALPDEDDQNAPTNTDNAEEVKFSLADMDHNSAISPSEEIIFKGDLVSIDTEENPKFSLMKAKFRVLMLKLKKSKCTNGANLEKSESPRSGNGFSLPSIDEREQLGKLRGKLLAVKLKVEEVPILSLFTRDKENHGKGQKRNCEDPEPNGLSDDRKPTKEVVQKYLKMVKPFYVRVSKRYAEKLKLTSPPPPPPPPPAEVESQGGETATRKQGNNLQAGLKVMRKRLGKSRSSPAAVTAAPPGKVASDRRDDSLLQVQDGIQGAILHCKRSFNASRDVDSASSSMLCRSVSDPCYEKAKGCSG